MSVEKSQYAKLFEAKICAYCGGIRMAAGSAENAGSCQTQQDTQSPNAEAKLSVREKQIVELIRQAKSNKEIAHELCLTVGTVKEYVYRIFRKLRVTNRTELALFGRNFNSAAATASDRRSL
jgi:DNA-binding NarL/FixJ family response regulator